MAFKRNKPKIELIPPDQAKNMPEAVDVEDADLPGTHIPPRKRGGLKSFFSLIPGVPMLLGLYSFMLDNEAEDLKRFKLLVAFIYIISPFDLIPEFFTGPLGFADDAAVLLWLLRYSVSPALRPYRQLARKWLRGQVDSLDMEDQQ